MTKFLLSITLLCVISFSIFAQSGATILDDTDAGWTWKGFDLDEQAAAYGGKQHVAEASGSTAEFEFTGSSIKFYGETWNGGPSLVIFIDGDSIGTYSQSITPEGLKNLFATITGLDDVKHSVKLVSIGEWASIDYVDFTPATILDDTDAGWTWKGFDPDEQAEAYGGQQHVAEASGSTAEFSFTGTNIDFYGETWNGGPSLVIFIDGDSIGTYSQSIAPEGLKNLFASITGLDNVKHSVKLVSIGEWAALDYVDFTPLPTMILDDTDAGWTWKGFDLDEQAEAYGGQQHVAEASGSTAEFEFTGSSIKFYGETWNGGPSLVIFIDGDSIGTYSQSITPEGLKNLFATITGLDDVKHSVKLVSIGEWAALDYVEYTSATIVVVPDLKVTVSGDNAVPWGEVAENLVDGDLNTKWSVETNTAWIQFAYKEAKRWNKYSLTSGNDAPTRDFKDWTLQGSNDGTAWTTLDTQTGHPEWATRNSTLDFAFTNLSAYKFYKFNVTANNGANVTQLSEIAFSFFLPEDALIYTTTGSAASYITYNNWYSLQADSIYMIEKTINPIVVDGVAESAWSEANAVVIKKVAHEKKLGDVLDLSAYPQTEADLYATYKALWTTEGVYMFIDVKDDLVRYQNPDYQWENDGIEFYFAKGVGEGKIQIIIPAMVGTAHPSKPAAKAFESGSAVGSDPAYKVFGFDANNWDETIFNWAIKKTATGYTIEVYMDKDIVTNGNSDTNYGLNKMFAGDVNVDEADEKLNDNDPALFVREGTLAMLGNSNQEYAGSNNYGWFKMVNAITTSVSTLSTSDFNVFYSSANKQITIRSNSVVSATLYNIAGQAMTSKYMDGKMNVANLKPGIYIINAKDVNGNRVGSSKVAIF